MARARQIAETVENFPTMISGLTILCGYVTLGWVDKRGA